MADGVKGAVSQVATDIGETLIKPVTDEVGKAIEVGAQSIIGGTRPIDPAVTQKKREEEQKKRDWAVKTIQWYKNLEEAQKKVRAQNQQQVAQKQQVEQRQQQVNQFQAIEKEKKAKELTEFQRKARSTELKGGVGG